jgi:hypothetical protein
MAQVMLQSAAMAHSRGRFATFMSFLAAAAAMAGGCEKNCPIAACAGWPVTARLNLPAGTQAGAAVVACHDQECAMAPLPPNPGSLLFDRTDVVGNVIARADGSSRVAVGWFVGKDGDRFSVVVSDVGGGQLASIEATPSFPPATTSDGCPNGCASVEFGDPP